MLLLIVALVTALIALWVVWLRPWLKSQEQWEWAQRFFAWIEPFEIVVYRKSETILWARTKQVFGVVVTAILSLGGYDLSWLTPLLPAKLQWLPSAMPLIISMVGWIDEQLRKDTTKPLEMVALPEEKKTLPAAVATVVAQAEASKIEALAVIKEAKKEGEM